MNRRTRCLDYHLTPFDNSVLPCFFFPLTPFRLSSEIALKGTNSVLPSTRGQRSYNYDIHDMSTPPPPSHPLFILLIISCFRELTSAIWPIYSKRSSQIFRSFPPVFGHEFSVPPGKGEKKKSGKTILFTTALSSR